MKIKSKDIRVNLPAVHLFDSEDDIVALAAAINTIIHGDSHVKYELLGMLNGQFVGLLYIKRNLESQELHDQFMVLIESEEAARYGTPPNVSSDEEENELINESDTPPHAMCNGCDSLMHLKGMEHCICGDEWNIKGRFCMSTTDEVLDYECN